jgi:hypothetical protein
MHQFIIDPPSRQHVGPREIDGSVDPPSFDVLHHHSHTNYDDFVTLLADT